MYAFGLLSLLYIQFKLLLLFAFLFPHTVYFCHFCVSVSNISEIWLLKEM